MAVTLRVYSSPCSCRSWLSRRDFLFQSFPRTNAAHLVLVHLGLLSKLPLLDVSLVHLLDNLITAWNR